jgi:peptide deformylase
MTLREIATLPNPVLKRRAKPVTKFDKDLQTLIDDMIETMREAPGVGLAAPQVDVSQQLIVIEYAEEDDKEELAEGEEPKPPKPKKLYVLANPEIVKASEEKVMGIEGCLSMPGLQAEVERHLAVQVKGLNRHGVPTKIKAEGWLARIFQHEIDHVNGILFTERAARVWQLPDPESAEEV